jgi:hypothetical protein
MDPAILIILIFIVAPLLEKLLKAGKKPGEPPQPRPGQPPVPPRPGQRQVPQQRPRADLPWEAPEPPRQAAPGQPQEEEREAAAAMLPDDLWEILTGERRAPPPTRPPADDEYEPDFDELPEDLPEELTAAQPEPAPWRPTGPARAPGPTGDERREQRREEAAAREQARDDAGSLRRRDRERDLSPAPYMHDVPVRAAPQVVSLEALSFDDEERHDAFHRRLDSLPAPAHMRRRVHPFAAASFTDTDLRRAVIMAEVLGPPRGLE